MPMPGRNRAISRFGAAALRKYQYGVSGTDEVADVAQRLPRAGSALGERERVEEGRRQVIVQAVGEPRLASVAFGKEVRVEEFLHHRRRDAVAPARRERVQDHRAVEVALVVRGENYRPLDRSRCSSPVTVMLAKMRLRGSIHVGRLARRTIRVGRLRFQDGKITDWDLTPASAPSGV